VTTAQLDGVEVMGPAENYLSNEYVQVEENLAFFEMKLTVNDNNSHPNFNCNKCGMYFSRQKNLKKHCEQYHQNDDDIKLEVISDSTEFSCKFCDRAFLKSRLLNRHVLRHLNDEIQNPKITKTAEQIRSVKEEIMPESTRTTENIVALVESFSCDYCAKAFQKKRLLRKHILRMHIQPKVVKPFKCTELDCDQAFPNEEQLEVSF
jgi:uncharacterized C2H2 Zn-finger protein